MSVAKQVEFLVVTFTVGEPNLTAHAAITALVTVEFSYRGKSLEHLHSEALGAVCLDLFYRVREAVGAVVPATGLDLPAATVVREGGGNGTGN